ncbi:MAG: hypothetical protein E7434_06500 [Ruminococcaceae bacterium]|nr:hypothetical protein [Oscillospiraceae bacterium]
MRRAEEGLLMLTCTLGQDVLPLTNTELQYLEKLVMRLPKNEPEGEVTEQFFLSLGYSARQAERMMRLLNRDSALHSYLQASGISVVTRLSPNYPERLQLLRGQMPTALFCKGDVELFQTRCIALVGSRTLPERNRTFAEHIGTLAAQEGYTLVSGGAVGADSAAQNACLAAGGKVICFVPDALKRYRPNPNILYCSDEGWHLPFTATRALRRNHYIHALGEKTFVAACPYPKGGTWSGANHNLNHHLSELYVLDDNTEGIRLLHSMGAICVNDALPSIAELMPIELSIFD